MERAKAAVSDFVKSGGKHDTTVHETVAPAVQHETVNEQREERRQVATDREEHFDHYHTTVQPVNDQETLPTQHHHNLLPTEHRVTDERDGTQTQAKLAAEASQFQHTSTRAPAQHSTAAAPTVTGEHHHHHVHETIQPVVHKQTVEPHVVHTTVPVHEVHHNQATHHAASALPAVSMADFQRSGGALAGRDEKVDRFAGEPRSIENSLGAHDGHHDHRPAAAAAAAHDAAPKEHETPSLLAAHDEAPKEHKKPSLLDKLNPKKDADGDGVAGFMK